MEKRRTEKREVRLGRGRVCARGGHGRWCRLEKRRREKREVRLGRQIGFGFTKREIKIIRGNASRRA